MYNFVCEDNLLKSMERQKLFKVGGLITLRPFFFALLDFNKGDFMNKLVLAILLMCIFAPMLH